MKNEAAQIWLYDLGYMKDLEDLYWKPDAHFPLRFDERSEDNRELFKVGLVAGHE